MPNQNIADLVKNHLDAFSLNFGNAITKSVDHLVAQQEKLAQESISQDKRIDRLELLIENLAKQVDKQTHETSKVLNTINEIALNQSNIDHDRRRFGEDIDALDYKLNKWQEDCTSKYNDANKEISKLQKEINRIYFTAAGVSGAAVVVGWVITTVLKALKVI